MKNSPAPPRHRGYTMFGTYVGPLRPYRQKNFGRPRTPHGGDMGGQISTFPPPPSNSPRQRSEFFRPRAGLDPGYNTRDFGKSAGNAAGDIVDFILAPGPRVCIMAQTYKTESFILLDTPPILRFLTSKNVEFCRAWGALPCARNTHE